MCAWLNVSVHVPKGHNKSTATARSREILVGNCKELRSPTTFLARGQAQHQAVFGTTKVLAGQEAAHMLHAKAAAAFKVSASCPTEVDGLSRLKFPSTSMSARAARPD